MINENFFLLWADWVASYLQKSLLAQVNGGSRCHHWPLKTVIFCGQGLRGYPGNVGTNDLLDPKVFIR